MSDYWVIIGALRNAAKKMDSGISPSEALELTAQEMIEAARRIDESRFGTKKSFMHRQSDDLRLTKEQLLEGNFDPDYKSIKKQREEQGAEFE